MNANHPLRAAIAAAVLGLGLGLAAAAPAQAAAGYRANLVACIMRAPACRFAALNKGDRDYLRYERSAFTRNPYLARDMADARLQPAVKVAVSEAQLDHMHARDVKFEEYRSTVRALRHGWVPGVNQPYEQPPEGFADLFENWRGR